MKIAVIRDAATSLSLKTWLILFAIFIVLVFISYGIYLYFHSSTLAADLAAEKQKNAEIQEKYEDALLESKKHEAVAEEYRVRAEALQAAIDEKKQSITVLDKNYEQAIDNYEEKKKQFGDCADAPSPDDCWKQQRALLCAELKALGYNCPEPR